MASSALLTQLLRTEDEQMWRWLRGALFGRGVDPAAAALAESCEQGDDSEFGVIVAADGEVFQFAFVVGGAVGASPNGTWGPSRTTLRRRIRTGRLTLYVCAVENAPPPQPPATPTDLLVLHTLRCIGVSELARIADAAGLSDDDTESELIDLGAAGLATYRSGVFPGWGLTEAGRAIDAERIADELHAAHAQSAVANAYDAFLPLNAELLDVCTAWQTRTVNGAIAMNDHHDADYDGAVLHRLEALHQRVGGPLVALATTLPRFDRYRVRLSDALRRARAGALEYVTDGVASYHTVWFQLHEDLLVTLGIPRH